MVPETRPLPAVLRANPPATSTIVPRRPTGRGKGWHGDSPARRPQADRPLRIPSRSPCSPQPFCDVSGVPLPAMLIDRWGPGVSQEQRWGPAGDRLPLRVSTGDPTPIMPVNGTLYSGEIESLDRDQGIATLDPGMRFPWN